ncbi:signal peptidase II [Natronospira proteinivora]|uniref:Lipoprotein signal peptidase n=1 Tax=Natronospira proteinivora TaxID=1807133 RepID=A0ABT1G557_9GAMM|nr:signal peptidase II [Natronospira proteinivora]MCP1726222.1 signal peptidase II [Natronospira proteinivora]
MLGVDIKKPKGPGALIWLIPAGVIIVLDQITKILIQWHMELYETINLTPFLNLRYLVNPGAAFSFLADAGGWQRWVLSVLAAGVSLAIIVWLWYMPRKGEGRLACGLAFILGGAVGNLIDRIAYGHVVDFIDVFYGSWHWPAFNVADSAITIGAILVIIDSFSPRHKA